MQIMNKRGLSPVIATMLLISIVIVIGLIIFLWLRGVNEEAITKFDGTNIKLICEEVGFEASYADGLIYIVNVGNVPIYQIKVKLVGEGSHTTETIEQDWPALGLTQGAAFSGTVTNILSANKILLIPVLIGKSEKGDLPYTCEERQGYEIII